MADAHALRAVDALVGITQDEAVRQVRLVVMVVTRLTIMEAIIRQAKLDAVLLQVTLTGSGTHALQAASRLTLGLFLQVSQLDKLETALALLIGQHGHLHLRLNGLVRYNIEEIGLALFQFQATRNVEHVFTTQKSMH